MTATKWLVFILMASALMGVFSGIMEMSYTGGGSPVWNDLLSTWGEVSFTPQGIVNFVSLPWEAIKAFWNIFTWNFAFLEGPWSLFRWVILFPLSAALAFTFMLTFVSIIRGGGG